MKNSMKLKGQQEKELAYRTFPVTTSVSLRFSHLDKSATALHLPMRPVILRIDGLL